MPIKTSIKTCYSLKIFLVLLLSGFAVACVAVPIKKADIKINHDLGAIKALDKTQVIIHMRPEDRKKVYMVRNTYRLKEGLIIESAAIKTFSGSTPKFYWLESPCHPLPPLSLLSHPVKQQPLDG